jgi:L-amino acid N-acyltransferase YncA
MAGTELIERVPWDSAALGSDAWELRSVTPQAFAQVRAPGHYTVKVASLADKRIVHENGFYYCDTLIEPFCPMNEFKPLSHPAARFGRGTGLEPMLEICHDAFEHGRFHRDFNVERASANLRYENWLRTLHAAGKVYGLLWDGELAGFIAHEEARLVLHAMGRKHRGRGIAKYLWSSVCADLARPGTGEFSSSISASNLAAVNLYCTLGFHFRKPVDVYHRVIP